MAEQAKVTSLDALELLRSAMILFHADARRAVDEVADEVKRTRMWLEHDQRMHWEREIRKRSKAKDQAQLDLFSNRITGNKEMNVRLENAVRKTKAALVEAEEKLRNTKKWHRNYDGTVAPLAKGLDGIKAYLDYDLPKAILFLMQAQKTLEGYAEKMAPPTDVAATPAAAEEVSQ